MKLSKRTLLSVVMIAGLGTMSAAQAYEDCNAKRAALENQIRIAEQYGNHHKVMGLKKALANVNTYCVDHTNSANALKDAEKKVQKLENKIADKKSDMGEIKADLNQANAKGDLKKVAKYQRKLSEKQAELQELQADLSAAQAEVAKLK